MTTALLSMTSPPCRCRRSRSPFRSVSSFTAWQGLEHGQSGQIGAGQAEREAEVVLDPGTGRGLAAGADAVQQHGVQALGRPVDRGRQAGWTSADDRDVNRLGGRTTVTQAKLLG